ncbi:MAG: hypothetical protein QXF28_02890 [Nitrososphaerota archaeon]
MKKKVLDFLKNSGLNLDCDEVLTLLIKGSSLTEAQAETLLVEYASQFNDGKHDTVSKASIRGVSKGAYARTKAQAINNIRQSIYTIMLLRYLGVLTDEGLARLMEVAEKLGKGEIKEGLELLHSMTWRDITT